MYRKVETTRDRKPEAIWYITEAINELDRKIADCDYIEDGDGNLVYHRCAYSEEKRDYTNQREKWATLLEILTRKTPFTYHA